MLLTETIMSDVSCSFPGPGPGLVTGHQAEEDRVWVEESVVWDTESGISLQM